MSNVPKPGSEPCRSSQHSADFSRHQICSDSAATRRSFLPQTAHGPRRSARLITAGKEGGLAGRQRVGILPISSQPVLSLFDASSLLAHPPSDAVRSDLQLLLLLLLLLLTNITSAPQAPTRLLVGGLIGWAVEQINQPVKQPCCFPPQITAASPSLDCMSAPRPTVRPTEMIRPDQARPDQTRPASAGLV